MERATSTTRADGTARTRWAVSPSPGENSVLAGVDGGPTARFTATSRSGTLRLHGREVSSSRRVLNTIYSFSGFVEAWVADSVGSRVIGAPISWDLDGMAPRPSVAPPTTPGWESTSIVRLDGVRYGAMDLPLPYAVARFDGQRAVVLHIPYWTFYEREQSLVGGRSYAPGDTAFVAVTFTETAHVDAEGYQPTLPIRLYDDNGWSVLANTSRPVAWPLGSRLGTRAVTICLPEPYAFPEECSSLTATVQPPGPPFPLP